jgi:[acyl-carrier-protein] S-malonyltransferase
MPDAPVAWVFPGQGSQHSGMGKDLYDEFASARELFDRADDVLARPLSRLCFEGPDDELGRTSNSQPALYVTSLACLAAARETGAVPNTPAFVSGHSLGEYTALAAAGGLEFDGGLRLVETRGRLTQAAADATPGGMAAVLGLDEDATRAVCAEAGAEVCNLNAPGQIVIGGAKDAVARGCELALERGAKRAMALDVGGAFHTSLMRPAVEGMRAAVAEAGISAPEAPLVANRDGRPLSDPAEIGEHLVAQLTNAVDWVACVAYMAEQGAGEFIEIGPGRVLTGLIKRIASGVGLRNVNGVSSLR